MIVATERHTAVSGEALGKEKTSAIGRVLLLFMLVVLFVDAIPDYGIGIVRGVSAKNLYLYLLCLFIVARGVANPSGIRFMEVYIHAPFLAVFVYAALTVTISGLFDPTYDEMRGVISLKRRVLDLYLLFIVSRYFVSSHQDYLWLLRASVLMLFLFVFLTLLEFLNVFDIGVIGTFKGRIEGPFGDANQFGALLAFMLPIAIGIAPRKPGIGRWVWGFGVLAMALLLLGTGSRGAYVAVVLGSIISAIYLREYLEFRAVAKFAAAGAAIIVILGIGFALYKPELVLQILDKSTTGNIETASSGRWAIWSAALGVMLEAPYSFVVGYGWNTFETSGIWKSAHSEYVNWFFETGLIGLFIILLLYLMIIRRARESLARLDSVSRRVVIGFTVGMIALAIDLAFVQLYNPWAIIWVVIGLVTGIQAAAPKYEKGYLDADDAGGFREPRVQLPR